MLYDVAYHFLRPGRVIPCMLHQSRSARQADTAVGTPASGQVRNNPRAKRGPGVRSWKRAQSGPACSLLRAASSLYLSMSGGGESAGGPGRASMDADGWHGSTSVRPWHYTASGGCGVATRALATDRSTHRPHTCSLPRRGTSARICVPRQSA